MKEVACFGGGFEMENSCRQTTAGCLIALVIVWLIAAILFPLYNPDDVVDPVRFVGGTFLIASFILLYAYHFGFRSSFKKTSQLSKTPPPHPSNAPHQESSDSMKTQLPLPSVAPDQKSSVRGKAYIVRLWDDLVAALAEEQSAVRGKVYILESGGYYKIGKTSGDLRKRVARLQTGSPHRIQVVHVINTANSAALEAHLHKRFNHKRTQGEWFALTPDDVQAIKRIQ
jgi:hypothetical protein